MLYQIYGYYAGNRCASRISQGVGVTKESQVISGYSIRNLVILINVSDFEIAMLEQYPFVQSKPFFDAKRCEKLTSRVLHLCFVITTSNLKMCKLGEEGLIYFKRLN